MPPPDTPAARRRGTTDRRRSIALGDTIERLRATFGARLSTADAIREAHGRGEGLREIMKPDAVVHPRSNGEVACVVKLCHEAGIPVIPFGAGTSLEGQVQAPYGGISLDMSGMDRLLSASAEDMDCHAQAGLTREVLNAELRGLGLFFPLDPGANATLGGMAATRASGTNAVRYGTMRGLVLGLTVVTPDGNIIKTGGRARKSAAGYDLTALYVGSEGTLGVITEVRLRLFGLPEKTATATCQFRTIADAVKAVTSGLQLGIDVARIELLDEVQMLAAIKFSNIAGFAPLPTLFLEFHGPHGAVDEQIELMSEIVADAGGSALEWAVRQEDRSRLWRARHDAYWAARSLAPGYESFATDACVPLSSLAACIEESKAEAAERGLVCPIVGHVGDGNFHMLVLFDPADPAARRSAEAFADSVGRRAIRMGGTCTGEHGIGMHKLDLMREEHEDAVRAMQRIKEALDPKGIMNPGKTVPGIVPPPFIQVRPFPEHRAAAQASESGALRSGG